jgi:hypothetical protein
MLCPDLSEGDETTPQHERHDAAAGTVSALQTLARRTISKISWRLLPLIVIIYFVAYIDRTNVSSLIAAGIDVLSISRRLGHGSPAITLGVYGHLFKPDDRAAAAIDEILGGGLE